MVHKKNDKKLLTSLEAPFIVYVDTNITDGWVHLPHFMLVTGSTDKFFDVFDPREGTTLKCLRKRFLKELSC